MDSNALTALGLDAKEQALYLRLLRLGEGKASALALRTQMPRTSVQNILNRLIEKECVLSRINNGVTVYSPIHPGELVQLVQMRRKQSDYEYEKLEASIKELAPHLESTMMGNSRLPGVLFYQGIEGVRKVLFDTLTSKTELLDFANIDAMFKHVKDINDEYVNEREKTQVTKRSLLLDTPFARKVYESGEYSPSSHKGYKWINSELYPFALEMNIYDGKVSYITYVEDEFVGVIIENQHIYEMHKSMWNIVWNSLPSVRM